jgi:3-hydroxyisobutyrate dehydrogenase-like beta-hydroxyacid dehydrogenase
MPEYYQELAAHLTEAGRADVKILDCSIVARNTRSSSDKSSIWISGSREALESIDSLLKAHVNVKIISGGLGSANKLRLTSHLLEATHAVTAAEATGLASKAGIDADEIYKIIINAAGNSSAYEQLVPDMLQRSSPAKPSIKSLLQNIVSGSHQKHDPRLQCQSEMRSPLIQISRIW